MTTYIPPAKPGLAVSHRVANEAFAQAMSFEPLKNRASSMAVRRPMLDWWAKKGKGSERAELAVRRLLPEFRLEKYPEFRLVLAHTIARLDGGALSPTGQGDPGNLRAFDSNDVLGFCVAAILGDPPKTFLCKQSPLLFSYHSVQRFALRHPTLGSHHFLLQPAKILQHLDDARHSLCRADRAIFDEMPRAKGKGILVPHTDTGAWLVEPHTHHLIFDEIPGQVPVDGVGLSLLVRTYLSADMMTREQAERIYQLRRYYLPAPDLRALSAAMLGVLSVETATTTGVPT